MPADPIITVEHLTAGYEGNVLMQDLNFSVHRGEVFIILGGSGSGKSTLLKHMRASGASNSNYNPLIYLGV